MKYLMERLGLGRGATVSPELPDLFELRLAKTLAREQAAADHAMLFRPRLSPQQA